MAATFKKGDAVGIVHTTLTGDVMGLVLVDDDLQYVVEYNDNDGVTQQRPFAESQITLTPTAETQAQ